MERRLTQAIREYLNSLSLEPNEAAELMKAASKRLRHLKLREDVTDRQLQTYAMRAVKRAIRGSRPHRPNVVFDSSVVQGAAAPYENSDPVPFGPNEREHLVQVFLELLRHEPKTTRNALRLLMHSHSVAQISSILDIPRTTLRRQLAESLERLRVKLLELADSDDVLKAALQGDQR